MVKGRSVFYLQILLHFSALCVAPFMPVFGIFLLLYFFFCYLVFHFFLYAPVAIYSFYRGADKSLARPTSRCFLFDGENISFDASLVIYIYIYIYTNSTNILKL